jgi:hypothetical protein
MAEKEKKSIFSFSEMSQKLLISYILHILSSLGGFLLSTFTAVKVSEILELTSFQKIIVISAVICLSIALIIYIFRLKYKKNTPQFEAINSDFEVLEKEFTHEYLEREKIKHIRKWTLKAQRNGLTSFSDKYFWTGGAHTVRLTNDDYKYVPLGDRNLYNIYACYFDRTLKKGEIVEVEVEWELNGPHKCFFSTSIEEPTEKLIMNIIFPREWNISKAVIDVAAIQGPKIPSSQKNVTLNNGAYKWDIHKPKLAHCYEVKWALK